MSTTFSGLGLVSKDLVRLRDRPRVLGLQVWEKDGTLRWKRSQIPEIPDGLTCKWVAQSGSSFYKVPGNFSLSYISRDFDQSMRSRSLWGKLVNGQ